MDIYYMNLEIITKIFNNKNGSRDAFLMGTTSCSLRVKVDCIYLKYSQFVCFFTLPVLDGWFVDRWKVNKTLCRNSCMYSRKTFPVWI